MRCEDVYGPDPADWPPVIDCPTCEGRGITDELLPSGRHRACPTCEGAGCGRFEL